MMDGVNTEIGNRLKVTFHEVMLALLCKTTCSTSYSEMREVFLSHQLNLYLPFQVHNGEHVCQENE
ncbi:unnamed protein product [Heterobilharzia americana]|nr:unnamed protein product [Heterobilharzia americana]